MPLPRHDPEGAPSITATSKASVDLGAVQETLLIPLVGRAMETRKGHGLIDDPLAVEIVNALDYDFDRWRNAPSLVGACFRTRIYDGFVREFLTRYPMGTVVELGCGLNTRFDRVDNGTVEWFDLDLPDVIALRRQFVDDKPRCTMLAASVLDLDWIAKVQASDGPWMFVSEAVLIYLEAAEVKTALRNIVASVPRALIALDTTSTEMVNTQAKHDAMKHLPPESWFRWACDDPREMEAWMAGVSLDRSLTFLDMDKDLIRYLPWPQRIVMRFAPGLMARRVGGYRMNLLRTGAPPLA
ncbi:MAG: class I SAM-dependent methyltransferase [Pseudomonadota bacterium]